ncbi:hypothetical protein LA6_002367 [Marinibacterium anthonyi]|nr:hypothetical protein LA6_002367 [Marinibacterium anthonyi]
MTPNRIGVARDRTASPRPIDMMAPPGPTPMALPVGTEIWTRDGAIPVEFLVPGDRIVTRNGGYGRVVRVEATRAVLRMMRIPAHALAPQRPDRDVILPARQMLLMRGASPPVAEDLGLHLTTLIALHLDRPDVIYASGLEIVPEMAEA